MRHFLYRAVVLLSVLFVCASFPAYAGYTNEEKRETECPTPDKREKYVSERLETISKEVGLTEEEKTVLKSELLRYDNNRFSHFKKTRQLRKELEKSGLSDSEYTSLLNQILEAELDRGKETVNLFKRLENKLSPEKRAKVYLSLRSYNGKIGKNIRGNHN